MDRGLGRHRLLPFCSGQDASGRRRPGPPGSPAKRPEAVAQWRPAQKGDPITPIWGAEAAVAELGNARLLKVNGEGHTSMFVEPSTCRDDAELGYLVSLQLLPKGAVCNVDQLPWGLSPGA
jgi:hypothetical protein